MARLRWLRWGDALLGWLVLLLGLSLLFPRVPAETAMVIAAGLLVAGSLILRVRSGWRPLSGTTTLVVSRRLRPGDRAWFVHGKIGRASCRERV